MEVNHLHVFRLPFPNLLRLARTAQAANLSRPGGAFFALIVNERAVFPLGENIMLFYLAYVNNNSYKI